MNSFGDSVTAIAASLSASCCRFSRRLIKLRNAYKFAKRSGDVLHRIKQVQIVKYQRVVLEVRRSIQRCYTFLINIDVRTVDFQSFLKILQLPRNVAQLFFSCRPNTKQTTLRKLLYANGFVQQFQCSFVVTKIVLRYS